MSKENLDRPNFVLCLPLSPHF